MLTLIVNQVISTMQKLHNVLNTFLITYYWHGSLETQALVRIAILSKATAMITANQTICFSAIK